MPDVVNANPVSLQSLANQLAPLMQGSITGNIAAVAQGLATETAARQSGDASNSASLSTVAVNLVLEINRATAAENAVAANLSSVSAAITTETTRATSAEGTLSTGLASVSGSLTAEKSRAIAAETSLSTTLTTTTAAVTAEVTRAQAAEASNASNISSVSGSLSAEITRAINTDATLTVAVSTEVTRAQAAEASNASTISSIGSTVSSLVGSSTTLSTGLAALSATSALSSVALGYGPGTDGAGNISMSAWVAKSRKGPLVPYGFVENNSTNWGYGNSTTFGVFASAARGEAAKKNGDVTSYTVNSNAIAQAIYDCSCRTGLKIDMGADQLLCTKPIRYPDNPVYPAYIVADGGGFIRQFDSSGVIAVQPNLSLYNIALLQNNLVSETSRPQGPQHRGVLMSTFYSYLQHYLTGALLTDRRNRWAVHMGDWTGGGTPVPLRLNPLAMPVAGTNTINLLDITGVTTGVCLIHRQILCWGTQVAAPPVPNATVGGWDVPLTPWTQWGATSAVQTTPEPLWMSSARLTSPIGNLIYTDTLPPGLPISEFEGSAFSMPGTYVLPGSILRTCAANTNVPQYQNSTQYAIGAQVNVSGRVFQNSTTGTSAATGPGPWALTGSITDNTCTWTYIGPAGYILTIEPPSGVLNAVQTLIPTNVPIQNPPVVILATGTFTNNTNLPGPWSPREWQGPLMSLSADNITLIDCEFAGVAGANVGGHQGAGARMTNVWFTAQSGTNGQVGAQGNAGGWLTSGGDLTVDSPRGSTCDDFFAIGPARGFIPGANGALRPLTNLPITQVTINNPNIMSFQARCVAAFLLITGSQKSAVWPTDPANPPVVGSNTLNFTTLAPGYTAAQLAGVYVGQANVLAVGTTVASVTGVPGSYVATLTPPPGSPYSVIGKGAPGPLNVRVTTQQPLQTLTSSINVKVNGGVLTSVGHAAVVGVVNTNSSGRITMEMDRVTMDMSFCNNPNSNGFSSQSTFSSTIRLRGCWVKNPSGQAFYTTGTHDYIELDGCTFDPSRYSVGAGNANVQIWGLLGGSITNNRFGAGLGGYNVQLGSAPALDIINQTLFNGASDVEFGPNKYLGVPDGMLGLDIAYSTNCSFDGWSSFTQASPIGVNSGAQGFRIDKSTSTGLYYNKFKFYIDGAPGVYLAGSGTFTTGGDFVPNPSGIYPIIAQASIPTAPWTPTVTPSTPGDWSVAYSTQSGYSVRQGALVFVKGSLTFTPTFTTASGQIQFSLPVTSPADGLNSMLTVGPPINAFAWPNTDTVVVMNVPPAKNYGLLTFFKSGAGSATMTCSNITSGNTYTVTWSGTYLAS